MTQNEVEGLRAELRLLKTAISAKVETRAARLRVRLADLEAEVERTRGQLKDLESAELSNALELVVRDEHEAICRLVASVIAARDTITDRAIQRALAEFQCACKPQEH
jgi:hypothetical protein